LNLNQKDEDLNLDLADKIGNLFQRLTKYSPYNLRAESLKFQFAKRPESFKKYDNVEKIKLPMPNLNRIININEIIKKRKSIREFSDKPISLDDISYLCWFSTGIQRIEHNFRFRTTPSAGALYPIETYLVVNNVDNLEQGIYHYSILDYSLEIVKKGNFKEKMVMAALGQEFCRSASIIFCHSAIFGRSIWKYSQRAFRYIYIEVGHIAQNLSLAVAALNLGGCHIGAFFDDLINDIIGLDGENESILYLTPIGSLNH